MNSASVSDILRCGQLTLLLPPTSYLMNKHTSVNATDKYTHHSVNSAVHWHHRRQSSWNLCHKLRCSRGKLSWQQTC